METERWTGPVGGRTDAFGVELGMCVDGSAKEGAGVGEGTVVKEVPFDTFVGGKGLPFIRFEVLPAVDVVEESVAGRWPWNWTFRF